MEALDELYQEIILDHNKRPQNFRVIETPTACAEGYNPTCGDELTVYLKIHDGCIEDIAFKGQGCAISRASASLMTVYLKGKTIEEAQTLGVRMHGVLTSQEDPSESTIEQIGDLAALSGVRKFYARLKCATLAWHTVEAAFQGISKVDVEAI